MRDRPPGRRYVRVVATRPLLNVLADPLDFWGSFGSPFASAVAPVASLTREFREEGALMNVYWARPWGSLSDEEAIRLSGLGRDRGRRALARLHEKGALWPWPSPEHRRERRPGSEQLTLF